MKITKELLNEVIKFKSDVSSKKQNGRTRAIEDAYELGKPNLVLDFYYSIASSQSYGPKTENLYINQNKFKKVPSSLDRGDFKADNKDVYGEYKFTYSPECKKRAYNFVQIRPWQKITGYVFEVYSDVEGFKRFNISKKDMNTLLEKYGHLAHGTKKANRNKNKEYAIRGKMGDDCWIDMLSFHKEGLFT